MLGTILAILSQRCARLTDSVRRRNIGVIKTGEPARLVGFPGSTSLALSRNLRTAILTVEVARGR